MSAIDNIKLLCFHFAGGNKYSYPGLKDLKGIDCHFFELPGRGDRFGEPLLRNMEDVLVDLFIQVRDHLSSPYAFFGHSMGSLTSFLLTHLIRQQGCSLPEHLFLSGRIPPSEIDEADQLYLLPKDRFWRGINDFGGVPDELLQYPDLMELYEPMIRADLQVLDSYDHEGLPPLDIPFTILHGSHEKLDKKSAQKWQNFSRRKISVRSFEGDHFFILNYFPEITSLIEKQLTTH